MNFNPTPIFLAFGVTFVTTPIAKKVAFALKILDHPETRKIHLHPIPLLGSIAVFLGFLAGLLFSGFHPSLHRDLFILLSTVTLLLVVGVLDDAGFLHPQIKLMGAMPVPFFHLRSGRITNSFYIS